MDRVLDLRLPARLEALSDLATRVDEFLPGWPSEAYRINVCLDELLTNTISHGFRGEAGHEVRVRLTHDDAGIEVFIEDDAPAFDPFADAPLPDLDAALDARTPGGLGVHFVRTMMDAFRYQREGGHNRVWLRMALSDGAAAPTDNH